MHRWLLLCLNLSLVLKVVCDEASHTLEIRMPLFDVDEEDIYLCTAVELPSKPLKLIAVEPHSDQDTVHHILLFGCQHPRNDVPVWPCRGITPCKDQYSIIYGWGRNAEKVEYPDGVAFSIGEGTSTSSLVLQVHYLTKRPKDDRSGIDLKLSERPSAKTASIVEYASNFAIPPGRENYPIPNECCYSGFEPLTTVAFRVHTHGLGRSVYMTKKPSLSSEETVIAERDPLLPQGFVPVKNPATVFPGDRLKVTCDFDSSGQNQTVVAGFTHQDEMCNMYMMIYSEIPHFGVCTDEQELYRSGRTGAMPMKASFQPEQTLSNFWNGPNSMLHENIGQGVGVDRDHDGRIWFLHRGDRTMDMDYHEGKLFVKNDDLVSTDPVLLLNPTTGEIESSWGAGFFSVPHMLTVDRNGSIWITDVGRHQVFKFSREGELLMTLGEMFSPGSGPSQFCAPTEVTVLTDGCVLVSDGYCNKRVVKFNANGDFMMELEDPELKLPHSLLADECADVLYVADRENQQVVVYQLSNLATRLGSIHFGDGNNAMALARGPYNTFLVLTWNKTDAMIFQIRHERNTDFIIASWEIPSVEFAHDLTLSAAPVELTGAGDRLFAVYIAETDGKKLSKFILCPPSFNVTKQRNELGLRRTADMEEQWRSEDEIKADRVSTKIVTSTTYQSVSFKPAFHSNPVLPHFRLPLVICSLAALTAALFYLKRKHRTQSFK